MGRALITVVLSLLAAWPSSARDAAQALPDRDAFLAEARKRLASNSLLQSRYFFRERVTGVRMNPFGSIGTGPEEVYEVYPVAGEQLTYRRLVERAGKPLPSSELAAQDRQFLTRYGSWQRQLKTEGQSEREARLKREAAERAKDRARADEAVGLFDFALDRRETLDGQPVIVVRFTPKANARPRTREARVASTFQGYAWIHEHEHELMKVEAEAIADTAFGYGIVARLYKGARARVTRDKVGSAWLPAETRVTGTGRALLFRSVTFNYLHQYSDYRPFEMEQLQRVLSASQGSK